MTTEKRRSGIAYQLDRPFEYMGHLIPQEDLYDMACKVNVANTFKSHLAYQWLKQRGMLPTKQHVTTQHNTSQQART